MKFLITLVVAMTAKLHSAETRAISLPFSLQLVKCIPNFTLSRAITYIHEYFKEEVLNVHPVVVGGGTDGYAFHVLSLKFSSLYMLLKS